MKVEVFIFTKIFWIAFCEVELEWCQFIVYLSNSLICCSHDFIADAFNQKYVFPLVQTTSLDQLDSICIHFLWNLHRHIFIMRQQPHIAKLLRPTSDRYSSHRYRSDVDSSTSIKSMFFLFCKPLHWINYIQFVIICSRLLLFQWTTRLKGICSLILISFHDLL